MDQDEERRLDALRSYRLLDTPPEPGLDRITALAPAIFGLPICTLALADRDRHWFKSRHGVEASEMPRRLSFCDETIRSEGVLVVPDALCDPRFVLAPVVAGPPHLRFYAGAPLVTSSGVRIGSLCVLDTEPHPGFAPDRQAILADLAATAMELLEARSRQIELRVMAGEIVHLASHDPLTGLANRRRLREVADDVVTRGQGNEVALLYLDLDGFKGVNDRLGHQKGDILLREVGRRLERTTSGSEIVARLGGDEFAVLLVGDQQVSERATALGYRLIRSLGRAFSLEGTSVRIGASVGLAVMPAGTGLDTLLGNADAALYRAKAGGRGRLAVASARPPMDLSAA